jgi:serine/threonine protein kinase
MVLNDESVRDLQSVHRDVKLENIFIAEDGRIRLGDFGLTMSMKQELAISPVGTVEYMAPEVRPYGCTLSQPAAQSEKWGMQTCGASVSARYQTAC